MRDGNILLLVALLVAIGAINLLITWLLVRRDRDPAELLGIEPHVPETRSHRSDAESRESARDEDALGQTRTETQTFETAADAELTPSGSDTNSDTGPPPLDTDEKTVVCRHCSTENRVGYRYCRWCVRPGVADSGAGENAGTTTTERSF